MAKIKLYYSQEPKENLFPKLSAFCNGWNPIQFRENRGLDTILVKRMLNDEPLSSRDLRRLVWLINLQISDEQCDSLIASSKTTFLLLRLSEICKNRIPRSVFFGLIYSYFQVRLEQVEIAIVRNNLEQIKVLIINFWERLNPSYSSSSECRFFNTIFDKNVIEIFAKSILHDDLEIIKWATSKFKIPTQSWFWEKVFECLCNMISDLTEEDFCSNINRYLDILVHAKENTTSPAFPVIILNMNKIWVSLVNRYANSSLRHNEPNQVIKTYCLATWNNPQNPIYSVKWISAGFTSDAIQMICSWCAYSDLTFFFDSLQHGCDTQRLNFWRKYIPRMSFTCVVLSSFHEYSSYNSRINVFKQYNKGRYSVSHNAPSESDAFIMVIGNFVFVEFSQTSNACFFYGAKNGWTLRIGYKEIDVPQVPFNIYSKKFDFIQELKGRNIGLNQYSSNRVLHFLCWETFAAKIVNLALRND